MSNQAYLQENWDAIKEKLRTKWKELTDDDLNGAKGDLQNLVDTIRRKTGEASENVEIFFGQILSNSNAAYHQAGESIRDSAQRVNASVQKTYAGMEDAVRHRPATSVAIGFAAGILTGLTLFFLIRRK
jgi:ElaB/YqjD/DUF883 family membrane-anchored ribosome-binding protein